IVLDTVRAEVALLRCMGVRIDEKLIVRAGDHAGAAADARVAVQIDDAVGTFEERVGRTDLRARRLVALIAEDRKEKAPRVGKCALVYRLHLAPIHADLNVVLGFAGDRGRVAADALSEVDGE